jgi:hypothetical protein
MLKNILILISIAFLLSSCAGGNLRAEHVDSLDEEEGTFTLITHGGNYLEDLETAAFFDIEGDNYEIRPFAPEFRYKAIEGLSVKEAMDKALHHVSFHPSLSGTWLKRIVNEKGRVIGYELRPLYMPVVYGEHDVMEIRYFLKEEGKVRAYVRIKERVEQRLRGGGDSYIWGK